MKLARLLTVFILIVFSFLIYATADAVTFDNSRFRADKIYMLHDTNLYKDVLLVVDDAGLIKKVRKVRFTDRINPFVKRFRNKIVLPGLVNPYAGTDCIISKQNTVASSETGYWNVQQAATGHLYQKSMQPWVTEKDELFALNSLHYQLPYLQYMVAYRLAHGTTFAAYYPTLTLNSTELEIFSQSYTKNAQLSYQLGMVGVFSEGTGADSQAEIDTKFKASDYSKPFLINIYSEHELMTLYRQGLISSRTIVVLHYSETSEDTYDILLQTGAKILFTPSSDYQIKSIYSGLKSFQNQDQNWGIGTSQPCSGQPSLLDELKYLKKNQKDYGISLTDVELWKLASLNNAKIMGLNKGIIWEGRDADFIVVSSQSDTLILDEITPNTIAYVYQKGNLVLDHTRIRSLRKTIDDLREQLDAYVRLEGEYKGQTDDLKLKFSIN